MIVSETETEFGLWSNGGEREEGSGQVVKFRRRDDGGHVAVVQLERLFCRLVPPPALVGVLVVAVLQHHLLIVLISGCTSP